MFSMTFYAWNMMLYMEYGSATDDALNYDLSNACDFDLQNFSQSDKRFKLL